MHFFFHFLCCVSHTLFRLSYLTGRVLRFLSSLLADLPPFVLGLAVMINFVRQLKVVRLTLSRQHQVEAMFVTQAVDRLHR